MFWVFFRSITSPLLYINKSSPTCLIEGLSSSQAQKLASLFFSTHSAVPGIFRVREEEGQGWGKRTKVYWMGGGRPLICAFFEMMLQSIIFFFWGTYGFKGGTLSAQSLSLVWLFTTPGTVVCQLPLFSEFSRQGDWSGLSFPTPGKSSQPRDWTWVFWIGRLILYHWATWEAAGDTLG